MDTNDYNARDVLETIEWTLRRKKSDIELLRTCNMQLRTHHDEWILLELPGDLYEKYHRLLFITEIENEVKNRN